MRGTTENREKLNKYSNKDRTTPESYIKNRG